MRGYGQIGKIYRFTIYMYRFTNYGKWDSGENGVGPAAHKQAAQNQFDWQAI
jgi:hypothetical protein